ncbi:MAG: leucine-rich repeat protein [Bacteroidales bacterium]|nr:leucine-rich repeat protein [Bacteroidales bacterium]
MELPASLTSIASYAFSFCSFTSVELPEALTSIGSHAFYGCSSLRTIEIPSKVAVISYCAFYGCRDLRSVTIGANVQYIETDAFGECENLNKIKFLGNTPPTISSSFPEYSTRMTYASNSSYGSLNENLGIVKVLDYLSSEFEVDGVKYVPLSPSDRTCVAIDCTYAPEDSVINIGETVNYRGVDMKVIDVYQNALRYNPCIKSFSDSNAGNIGDFALYGCTSLQTATISNKGSIGDNALRDCTSLQTVSITNTGAIGEYALYGCSALKSVQLGEEITDGIGSYAFAECTSLESINIPSTHTVLNSDLFYNCKSLKSIQLPSTLKTINSEAFAYSGLESITIPAATTTIGNSAFYGCTSLKEFVAKNGDTDLSLGYGSWTGQGQFYDCPLERVKIGRNLKYNTGKTYGYSPFYRCETLKSVELTDFPTEVYANEFYGCTALEDVTIGDGVTKIGDYAFSGCLSLKEFTFGSSVETIGAEAFSDCTAMTSLYAEPAQAPTCGTQALDDINKWDCTLYVPEGYVSTYQAADQWKDFFFVNDYTYSGFPGDANGDNYVTVADVAVIVSAVMGVYTDDFSRRGADVNSDGVINVIDVTMAINLVLSGEYDAPESTASADAAWSGYATGNEVELSFIGQEAFSATQFDVELPAGVTITGAKSTTGHSASYEQMADGRIRVVVASDDNRHFDDLAPVVTLALASDYELYDAQIAVKATRVAAIVGTEVDEQPVDDALITLPHLSGVESMAIGSMEISTDGHTLIILSPAACSVTMTTVGGVTTQLAVKAGRNTFEIPAAGIYIVNGQKVVIR